MMLTCDLDGLRASSNNPASTNAMAPQVENFNLPMLLGCHREFRERRCPILANWDGIGRIAKIKVVIAKKWPNC